MEKIPQNSVRNIESSMEEKVITPVNLETIQTADQVLKQKEREDAQIQNDAQIAFIRKELGIAQPTQAEGKNFEDSTTIERDPIILAKKINSFSPEELKTQFSTQQLFDMLNSLPMSYGDQQIPKEVLDAEARIYETYKPSEALQERHKNVNQSSVGSYDPKELFLLREQWKTKVETDKKIDFVKSYVEKLSKEYGINQDITVAIYDEPFHGESAMWMPSYEKEKIGVLILYRSVLEKNELPTILSDVSHEIAHCFQEFVQKGIGPIPEELNNDQAWFKVYKNRHRESTAYTDAYKNSQDRYKAIPLEQDAWAMQMIAYEEVNKISEKYADDILEANGIGTYSSIKDQSIAAAWITRNIKEDTTLETLIEAAKKVGQYFPEVASRITNLLSGKSLEEVIEIVQNIQENRKKAEGLLGLVDQ